MKVIWQQQPLTVSFTFGHIIIVFSFCVLWTEKLKGNCHEHTHTHALPHTAIGFSQFDYLFDDVGIRYSLGHFDFLIGHELSFKCKQPKPKATKINAKLFVCLRKIIAIPILPWQFNAGQKRFCLQTLFLLLCCENKYINKTPSKKKLLGFCRLPVTTKGIIITMRWT